MLAGCGAWLNSNFSWADPVEICHRCERASASIHERKRFHQKGGASSSNGGVPFCLSLKHSPGALCEEIEHGEADVVTSAGIIRAGISEASDKPNG